jgi:hypothetical protein
MNKDAADTHVDGSRQVQRRWIAPPGPSRKGNGTMRSLLGIAMLGFLVVGCAGSAGVASSASPHVSATPVVMEGPVTTDTPAPVPTPVPTPEASVDPVGPSGPAPDLPSGMRLDLADTCEPIPLDLASKADAGLMCKPNSKAVESVVILRFPSAVALLSTYLERIDNNGIGRRSHGGRCEPGVVSEGGYVPGDGGPTLVPERSACFVDGSGKAHYLATIPPWVLVEVTGTGGDMASIQDWAWLGNRDAPGNPTIWREGVPPNPNG